MTSEEIASLFCHKSIKCLASPTRGEGYGLPLIDAAVSGIPVVATNWSGHLEFLESDLFYPVMYDLKAINKTKVDNRIFYEGVRWAEPRKESFIRQIKSVYNDYETAKNKASTLSNKIKNDFNKKEIKIKYDKILDNL